VPHTVATSDRFDSRNLGKGQSWSYTVRKKGSIIYHCAYHSTMKGELVVK
jgi:plastocyanin